MAVYVAELIKNREKPMTTTPKATIRTALNIMLEHDYSQLPVVDDGDIPRGMVSVNSILRGIVNFGASVDDFRVSHVQEAVPQYDYEDDIFDLLAGLGNKSAALILKDGQLTGIVTEWDISDYFRQRVEDIIRVENIEKVVKEHINASFTNPQTGILDEEARQKAILSMSDDGDQMVEKIYEGLKKYLAAKAFSHNPDRTVIEETFNQVIKRNKNAKEFNKLTFNEYSDILLTKTSIEYREQFQLPTSALQTMLKNIREIRNDLAHFRPITNAQRNHLRAGSKFFDRYPPHFGKPPTHAQNTESQTDPLLMVEPVLEESFSTETSRYTKLADYLRNVSSKQSSTQLTFSEIETVIGGELPPSARTSRSWWANDGVGHVQSKQWLGAGWRVTRINLTESVIVFTRMLPRETAYIQFFSTVRSGLRNVDGFPLLATSPNGANWISVASLPRGSTQQALFAYVFDSKKRYRVELYIDTYDGEKNKEIYQQLHQQKYEIESLLGEELSWQRLEHRRASRIALYHPDQISIESSEGDLVSLRNWSVDAMLKFYNAIAEKATGAINAAL